MIFGSPLALIGLRSYCDGFTQDSCGPRGVGNWWGSSPKDEAPIGGYYSDSGWAIIYTPDHPDGVVVADPMSSNLPGTGIPPMSGDYIETHY
mmetsp:Transcript_14012/g.21803  ORF Transcript_14012/g.21803 Transcript_14012/m.21803 type:complete len:92 (+) Transcript_14012:114-389(+)